jgi:hypothetical protein
LAGHEHASELSNAQTVSVAKLQRKRHLGDLGISTRGVSVWILVTYGMSGWI